MADLSDCDEEPVTLPKGRDVLRNGQDIYHGLVRKLVLTEGAGKVIGNTDPEVTCALTMYVHDRQEVDERGEEEQEEKERTSASDLKLVYRHRPRLNPFVRRIPHVLPIGLQRALMTMAAGERAFVWVDPLMGFAGNGLDFGDEANEATLPPDTALVFDVTVRSFREAAFAPIGGMGRRLQFENMPQIDDDLEKVEKLLSSGRRAVAQRQLCRTIRKLESMRIDATVDPKHEKERRAVLLEVVKLAGENALELGWYKLAVTFNRQAIELDRHNAYAHYLLGRAYFALGYSKSARYFVQRATVMDLLNDVYAQKLSEIRRHAELMRDDSDSEDELETFEMLADVIIERHQEQRKQTLKQISKEIPRQQIDGVRTILLEGGFDEAILEEINNRLVQKNRGVNSVIVERMNKSLRICLFD